MISTPSGKSIVDDPQAPYILACSDAILVGIDQSHILVDPSQPGVEPLICIRYTVALTKPHEKVARYLGIDESRVLAYQYNYYILLTDGDHWWGVTHSRWGTSPFVLENLFGVGQLVHSSVGSGPHGLPILRGLINQGIQLATGRGDQR